MDIYKFERYLKVRGLMPNSIYAYKLSYNRYVKLTNKTSLDKENMLNFLANSNTGVNRALIKNWIDYESPKYDHIRLPRKIYRKKTDTPKVLSDEQIQVIKDNMPKKYLLIIELMEETGIRINEALTLKMSMVDVKNNVITITGKGGKKQKKYPSTGLVKKLKDRYESNRNQKLNTNRFVFYDPKSKYGTFYRQYVNYHLSRIVNGSHNHMFRHTFATKLNKKGVVLNVIQGLMGHSSISTTSIYAHVGDDELREAAEKAHINE